MKCSNPLKYYNSGKVVNGKYDLYVEGFGFCDHDDFVEVACNVCAACRFNRFLKRKKPLAKRLEEIK